MTESRHKQNLERTSAAGVPSYSQMIMCQDEHFTINKRLKPSVKIKTNKPHAAINNLMERMANDAKLLDQ